MESTGNLSAITETQPAMSKPVAQILNRIKPPEFVQWAVKLRREIRARLSAFAEHNGFSMQDVTECALLDYMDNYERLNPTPTKAEHNL